MKRSVKNITVKLFVMIMVSVMGLLIANNILFLHNHQLADGSIVTHAHPFNKSDDSSPFKQHQHTGMEFFLLQNSDILFTVILLSLSAVFLNGIDVSIRHFQPSVSLIYIPLHQGRAPPVL